MLSFLKTCGRGFIVIISSPLWLLFFALYIVYGLMLFIYMVIKAIVKLFSKNHLTIETEYDKKAKIILSNPSFDFRYGTTNRQDIYPQQQYFYQPQFQQPTYQPQPQPQPAPQYNNQIINNNQVHQILTHITMDKLIINLETLIIHK